MLPGSWGRMSEEDEVEILRHLRVCDFFPGANWEEVFGGGERLWVAG